MYDALLGLDLFGIWLAQVGGTLVPLAASVHCYGLPVKVFFWAMYLTAGAVSLKQVRGSGNLFQSGWGFL